VAPAERHRCTPYREANVRIIAVDFDGVINSYASGWTRADDYPDPPNEGAIAWLNEMRHKYTIVIVSSRLTPDGRPDGLQYLPIHEGAYCGMRAWLVRHGIDGEWIAPALSVRDFQEVSARALLLSAMKPPAWLSVDDRAFVFRGTWPGAEAIDDFRPWNRRDIVT
jgi:hypothetical protein